MLNTPAEPPLFHGRRPDAGLTTAYVGIGSNLPERAAHLTHALHRLDEVATVSGASGVYESDAVGCPAQPSYLNMVARLETELGPEALLERLQGIEAERGRERSFKNAPRTLDLDLLLHGDHRLDLPGLTIPHPRMTKRAFVLVPLLELDPGLVEPHSGRPYRDYLADLERDATGDPGATTVRRVADEGPLRDGNHE